MGALSDVQEKQNRTFCRTNLVCVTFNIGSPPDNKKIPLYVLCSHGSVLGESKFVKHGFFRLFTLHRLNLHGFTMPTQSVFLVNLDSASAINNSVGQCLKNCTGKFLRLWSTWKEVLQNAKINIRLKTLVWVCQLMAVKANRRCTSKDVRVVSLEEGSLFE